MKKSEKYNLLSKDQPKKEKTQQEWIQMQSVNRWENNKNQNSNTSYMKLEDQYSEIQRDDVHLNSGNQNSSYNPNIGKNNQQYKVQNTQNMKSPSTMVQNKSSQQVQPKTISSTLNNQKFINNRPQQQPRNSQLNQNQPNPMNSQYRMPSQYHPQQSSFCDMYPYQNFSVYEVVNNQQPLYSQYGGNPNAYNENLRRQSQFNSPNYSSQYQQSINPRISQVPQQMTQNSNRPISNSSMNSKINRSTFRQAVPQMTVNCDKCTFTQSVPGNTQMYICCMCNEIIECFPLYGVFTCGICMAKVIYPYGTSTLIKCTKCQTVNRVNPQPKKKQNQNVVMGKQQADIEQKQQLIINQQQNVNKYEQPKYQMKRNQPVFVQQKAKRVINSNANVEQPFKVLSAKKKVHAYEQQEENQDIYPEIQPLEQQKRQAIGPKVQFTEQLIELDNNVKNQKQNLQKQLLELSQKLDQSLIISKDQSNHISPQKSEDKNIKQLQPNKLNEYPSIFDD